MSALPYIYRGIVKDNADPLSIGRCRVHVPDIHGSYDYDKSLLPWSRPVFAGSVKIPEVESIVWVMFEDGNKDSPVYLTGVITTKAPLESTDIDIIYSHGDCKIYYCKSTGELYITNKDTTIYSKEDTIDLRGKNILVNGEEIGSGSGGTGGGIWTYKVVAEVK